MSETIERRPFTFSLRALLALMAGCSFIGFVTHWLHNVAPRAAIFIIPWSIGSFAGIYLAARLNRNTLLGAICGGLIAHMLFPGTIIIYLYLNKMNGVHSLRGLWMQLALAAFGSGLLAAIVEATRSAAAAMSDRPKESK